MSVAAVETSKQEAPSPSLTVVALNIGLAGTAVAAVVGFVSHWLLWPADLFAPFRLQYAMLFLVAVVVALVLRQPRTAAVALLLFLWQATSLVPLVIGTEQGEPNGETLRLLHFNVLAYNTNYDEVGGWVADQNADIIVLQETSPEWGDAMTEALADWVLLDTDTTQPGTYGMMMFAAPHIDVTAAKKVNVGYFPAIATTVRVAGQDLLIYGVHTLTPTTPGGLATANRQIDVAVEVVEAHSGPVVIAGDLNATRWSPVYRRLNDQVELSDTADGAGLTGTWPDSLWFTGRIGIDHVLTSPDMCSFDRRLGPSLGSDHSPVVIDLAVSGCQ